MDKITEILQVRAKFIADARKIADTAEAEKRNVRAEEKEQIETNLAEAAKCQEKADDLECRAKIEAEERKLQVTTRKSSPLSGSKDFGKRVGLAEDIRTYLLGGTPKGMTPEALDYAAHRGINVRANNCDISIRALGHTNSAGGYTVPDQAMGPLERTLKYFGPMRQAATIMTTETGAAWPHPTNDDTGNTGHRIGENVADSELDPTFGQIVFGAHVYSSKIVRVPVEMLEDASFDFESYLNGIFEERIGRVQNLDFTTGDGSNAPYGIVTSAGDSGVTAGASALTMDNLEDLIRSVDPIYRDQCAFMMNDSTVGYISKLKGTTNDQYYWQPSLQAGQPDRLKGFPIWINNNMAAVGTGNKSVLFGNFKKYLIRDVRQLTFSRFVERYAEYRQIGFVMHARADGALLNANAVKYLDHA